MKNVKLIVLIAAVVVLAILVVQNTDQVTTRLLFIELNMPRAVLLFLVFAIGFAAGAVTTMRVRKPKPQVTS
jgi:uncharacterized integral membrane protein